MTRKQILANVAMSFFRGRHDKAKLYKNSKRKNAPEVSQYANYCRLARLYIARARKETTP